MERRMLMEKFVINGQKHLQGEMEVRGAKNAAFPLLAASLLTREDCIIENIPFIEDVFRMIEILKSMGADVEWVGERVLRLNTRHIDPSNIDARLVSRLRGSVLFLGPLLARFGKVSLLQPGGDIIGARPIDTHLDAFLQLGVKINQRNHNGYALELSRKPKDQIVVLNEFSVTATENVLLFAAFMPSKITVKIADLDYQVQELIHFLRKMGANITTGLHTIMVKGSAKLKGVKHRLMYDPIEAGTFVLLAAAAKGEITVAPVEFRFLEFFFKKLKDFRLRFDAEVGPSGLAKVKVFPSKGMNIDKIQSFIYPGIHSDLQSAFGVLATQTKGPTLLHDPLYEGRLKYLEELNKMGAEIYFTDPHRAIIMGPSILHGADLGTFDLRGGAALVIAALIAKGQSTIRNVYQIDRGYEKIEERLEKVGADIKRVTQ